METSHKFHLHSEDTVADDAEIDEKAQVEAQTIAVTETPTTPNRFGALHVYLHGHGVQPWLQKNRHGNPR